MKKRFSNTNEVYWGKEPDRKDFEDSISPNFNKFLTEALNWYNYSSSLEKKKGWFIDWVRVNRPEVNVGLIEANNDGAFTTAGAIARLHSRGLVDSNYLNRKLDNWVRTFSAEGETIIRVKEGKKTIKKRIGEKDPRLSNLIGLIEIQLDLLMENDYKPTNFDMSDWILRNNPSPVHLSAINDRFLRLVEELTDTDDQVTEAYSHLSEEQFNNLLEFLLDVVSAKKMRKARVVRKKKNSPPSKQVSKLKCAVSDPDTGVKSISPTDIPGSKCVWIWNKKYRMIGAYHVEGDKEIGVKGTTLINIDADSSVWKKVRKPESIIPQIMAANKIGMKKIFEGINSKCSKMTGRINSDTVILKAF